MLEIIGGAWCAIGYVLVLWLLQNRTPDGLKFWDFFMALLLSVFGPFWFFEVFRKDVEDANQS